jgi:hypothetical protein
MDKIKFEDNDILERFYQETNISQVEILTEKQFFDLPLNPEYEKNKKKREEAIEMLITHGNNLLSYNNNEHNKLKQQ